MTVCDGGGEGGGWVGVMSHSLSWSMMHNGF